MTFKMKIEPYKRSNLFLFLYLINFRMNDSKYANDATSKLSKRWDDV
jgi:hypothetical protein